MRLVIWHGYLLGGTGSNVYTRQLAREWAREGHDVVVAAQEPDPQAYDLGGAEVIQPDTGPLLPVFVRDRYAGRDVQLVTECGRESLEAWVAANAAAVRDLLPADLVLCNHVLLGGPVGAATGARFAVKVHGSELEYAMRSRPDLSRWGARSLASAAATFVGSTHIAGVLADVCGPVPRVRVVPPGVDVEEWAPLPRAQALARLVEAAEADGPNGGDERRPDDGNAGRLARFWSVDQPAVVYFGKLIPQKGVDVLLRALAGTGVRAVVAGFGPERPALEELARDLGVTALFTGPLEHRHLAPLLALADACVVPSVFPEAFGMVAAEAAATGCPPLVADHSGLAEIAAALADAYPPGAADLVACATGDPLDLRARLLRLLGLPDEDRERVRAAARRVAVDRWSWAGVGRRILADVGVGDGASR
jgi:glycosyltransferase involved in cell wall biosynthesis